MIVLCCEYEKEYDITFNPQKMCVLNLEAKLILMNMCQLLLESVRHLGNLVDSTLFIGFQIQTINVYWIC